MNKSLNNIQNNVISLFKVQKKCRKVVRTKNRRIMLLSKCALCNNKKLKFPKEQGARLLLSIIGIKTNLSQILLFGPLLF